MSCCGKAREQFRATAPVAQAVRPAEPSSWPARMVQGEPVPFEYAGHSAMSAVGPITRRVYRFDHPGAVSLVDVRDVPGMLAVPKLRPARSGL